VNHHSNQSKSPDMSTSKLIQPLNIAIITGTTRTSGPPHPVIGPRVATFIKTVLEQRGNTVSLVDARSIHLSLLEKPHFAYQTKQLPENLKQLHTIFKEADAYVAITPEYNHAPSPALLNILNHFGSSTFSFKPSAIVSYSAGQWGGTRAAHSLRAILSELGCLPVSAMVHIPFAHNVLDDNGDIQHDEEKWQGYVGRCFNQLSWWGNAAKDFRVKQDPDALSPAFNINPSQRSSPQSNE
jgi:chromate reductase